MKTTFSAPWSLIRTLTCSCCGRETIGRQWFNRDTGFGICPPCVEFVRARETTEDMTRMYGTEGTHYNIGSRT